jgi:hypothetical protein
VPSNPPRAYLPSTIFFNQYIETLWKMQFHLFTKKKKIKKKKPLVLEFASEEFNKPNPVEITKDEDMKSKYKFLSQFPIEDSC